MASSNFEVDINKVFLLAISALLSWNVWMTQTLIVEVAVLKSKAEQTESTRFTSTDGALLSQRVELLANQLKTYDPFGDYPQ